MIRYSLVYYFLLFLFSSFFSTAQKSEVEIDKLIYDIGDVLEGGVTKKVSFYLLNKGKYPVELDLKKENERIKITSPDSIIAPEQNYHLTIEYTTPTISGKFHDMIQLYLKKAIPQVAILTIKGEVHKNNSSNSKIQFNKKALFWDFTEIPNKFLDTLKLINFSKKTATIHHINLPDYLKISSPQNPYPIKIAALQTQEIIFSFDTTKISKYGFFSSHITFNIEEKEEKKLPVWGHFVKYGKKTGKKSSIFIEKDTLMVDTSIKKKTIPITNTGNDTLEINRITYSCNYLRIEMDNRNILPNSSVYLTLFFTGIVVEDEIYIYSNDPEKPVIRLYVVQK